MTTGAKAFHSRQSFLEEPPFRAPMVMCRRLCHSFATHKMEKGYIRTVQELFGHNVVKTTMIYTYLLNRAPAGVNSPLDGFEVMREDLYADRRKTL